MCLYIYKYMHYKSVFKPFFYFIELYTAADNHKINILYKIVYLVVFLQYIFPCFTVFLLNLFVQLTNQI